jgi:uncharacterized protein (DUF2141 family)
LHQDYANQIGGKNAVLSFQILNPEHMLSVVIHDENCNGELDTNMFGIPTEGHGFSVVQRSQ